MRGAADKAGGLDQDAAELAVAVDPQVVGPFEADARALRARGGQLRLQALRHAQAHGQRQAGPVGRRQRHAQREGQRIAHAAGPLAAQPAPAGGLHFGHQQHGFVAAIAGACHQLGIGRADAGHDLHGKARQLRLDGLPQRLRRPVDGDEAIMRPPLSRMCRISSSAFGWVCPKALALGPAVLGPLCLFRLFRFRLCAGRQRIAGHGRAPAALGRQQRAAAGGRTAPAGILGLQLPGVGFVDDQAVVVAQLSPAAMLRSATMKMRPSRSSV